MKEILVSQPEYVSDFSCIGAACEDHCCKQWTITLDKNTYKKYLKSEIPGVKNIAVENIILTKKSPSNWAVVKLNEKGNCSYLESDNLCQIHRTMGPEALSKTCSIYPRHKVFYKKEVIESLNLSCPEAARKVLFSETSLNIHNKTVVQAAFNDSAELNIEGKIVNLFSANLLMTPLARIEHNLYALVCFLLYTEKLTGSLDSKLASMESAYAMLVQQMNSGEIAQAMGNVSTEQRLELALISSIQQAIGYDPNIRGRTTLLKYVGVLNQRFDVSFTEQEISENLLNLKQGWNQIALPWLAQHPSILRNYFQYRLYHDRFAIDQSLPVLKQLYLLVVDYFYIKSLLSAHVLEKGNLNEKVVIDVIYSYHSYRQHTQASTEHFIAEIDRVKRNDDLSVLQLLV
jgi:lysine-N-methylase